MEIFESNIGKIKVVTDPWCNNCSDFYPRARRSCKTDNKGRLLFNNEQECLYDGIIIRCEYQFRCQAIRRDMIEREKVGKKKGE